MCILKSTPKSGDTQDQPNTKRRSFLWKMGAAMSAVLASAVPGKPSSGTGQDAGLKNQVDSLSSQLGILEDENAIRRLHQIYENLLNSSRYEEVVSLFSDDGEAVFNGGTFKGKSGGVHRLYTERFKQGLTGKRIEPPPGFPPDTEPQPHSVKIAANRKSASANFSYSIQVGTPLASDSQLVQMARLHGEGIMRWWEGGIYEISYVKDSVNSGWKIRRLEYRALSKAGYRPGKSHASPISIPRFSKTFPEDPAGPDILENKV